MSFTGKEPISRRMGGLLSGRQWVEERGPGHGNGEGLERRGHDAHAEGVVLLWAQRRVAADVLDARAANPPVGARGEGEVVDGRDHSHRNSDPLDLLGYRCAATIARSSGGDEQRPIDARGLEAGGDVAPGPGGDGDRRAHAGQRVDVLVDAADLALAL